MAVTDQRIRAMVRKSLLGEGIMPAGGMLMPVGGARAGALRPRRNLAARPRRGGARAGALPAMGLRHCVRDEAVPCRGAADGACVRCARYAPGPARGGARGGARAGCLSCGAMAGPARPNEYVDFLKGYAAQHNLSYPEAMLMASETGAWDEYKMHGGAANPDFSAQKIAKLAYKALAPVAKEAARDALRSGARYAKKKIARR